MVVAYGAMSEKNNVATATVATTNAKESVPIGHNLFVNSPLDARDEFDERHQLSYNLVHSALRNGTSNASGVVQQQSLTSLASRDQRSHEDVCIGLVVSILTSPDADKSNVYYRHLTLVARDGLAFACSHLTQLVLEKYTRMHGHCRQQLLWLTRQLIQSSVQSMENICWNLMRQIAGGCLSQPNLWLADNLIDIYVDNRGWLEKFPFLLASVVYTYLRIIDDHFHAVELRDKEVRFVVSLMRSNFADVSVIGRDLVRVLQNVAHIEPFQTLWFDILHQPSALASNFTGLAQLMQTRTSRRFLQSRITPDMEKKIVFLTSQVRFGAHKKYQEWFQRQHLCTPESQSLRCDLIRFIVGVIHPTNELLNSDIIPRWAVIGWLLTTCTNQLSSSNAKLALFYDWLYFCPDRDNIMNIEPGILVIHHSMRSHPAISATLLDFLARITTAFNTDDIRRVQQGVFNSLSTILEKRVVQDVVGLFTSPRLDCDLRSSLNTTFAPFFASTHDLSASDSSGQQQVGQFDGGVDVVQKNVPINGHATESIVAFSPNDGHDEIAMPVEHRDQSTPQFSDDEDDVGSLKMPIATVTNFDVSDEKENDGPLFSTSLNSQDYTHNSDQGDLSGPGSEMTNDWTRPKVFKSVVDESIKGSAVATNSPIPLASSDVDFHCGEIFSDDASSGTNHCASNQIALITRLVTSEIWSKTSIGRSELRCVAQRLTARLSAEFHGHIYDNHCELAVSLNSSLHTNSGSPEPEAGDNVCHFISSLRPNIYPSIFILFHAICDSQIVPCVSNSNSHVTSHGKQDSSSSPPSIFTCPLDCPIVLSMKTVGHRKSLILLLAELRALQPRVGYYLLYFLTLTRISSVANRASHAAWLTAPALQQTCSKKNACSNSGATNSSMSATVSSSIRMAEQVQRRRTLSVYRELCESIDGKIALDLCLVNDLRQCQDDDVHLFVHLVPDLFVAFNKQAAGNVHLIYLVVSVVDGHQLARLVHRLASNRDLRLFKDDSASLTQLIEASLVWETFEQVAFWTLICAHDISRNFDLVLPSFIARLSVSSHAEALTSIMNYVRGDDPTQDVIRALFLRPCCECPVFDQDDTITVSVLHHWLQQSDPDDMLADLVTSYLHKQVSLLQQQTSGTAHQPSSSLRTAVPSIYSCNFYCLAHLEGKAGHHGSSKQEIIGGGRSSASKSRADSLSPVEEKLKNHESTCPSLDWHPADNCIAHLDRLYRISICSKFGREFFAKPNVISAIRQYQQARCAATNSTPSNMLVPGKICLKRRFQFLLSILSETCKSVVTDLNSAISGVAQPSVVVSDYVIDDAWLDRYRNSDTNQADIVQRLSGLENFQSNTGIIFRRESDGDEVSGVGPSARSSNSDSSGLVHRRFGRGKSENNTSSKNNKPSSRRPSDRKAKLAAISASHHVDISSDEYSDREIGRGPASSATQEDSSSDDVLSDNADSDENDYEDDDDDDDDDEFDAEIISPASGRASMRQNHRKRLRGSTCAPLKQKKRQRK